MATALKRMGKSLLVDCHTHVYLPQYISLLRSRQQTPRIHRREDGEERLFILDNESLVVGGRPVGPQYWSRKDKIAFMDTHGIDVSVISCANPWLDWLEPKDAVGTAEEMNIGLQNFCDEEKDGRLFGLGLLPLVPTLPPSSILPLIESLKKMPKIKGLIMGTRGFGSGLDDPAMDAVWASIQEWDGVVFLHPHYGLGNEEFNYGSNVENGHVLQLAMGFPMETTIAVTRLILSGALDKFPKLKFLLAHSGGCIPQLSSRLASCVKHDPVVQQRLEHDPRYYLGRNFWFDAVSYGPEEMEFTGKVAARASRYTSLPSAQSAPSLAVKSNGSDKMLFGTDHPFFPPLSGDPDEKWESVVTNLKAIEVVNGWAEEDKEGVKGLNAVKLFGL